MLKVHDPRTPIDLQRYPIDRPGPARAALVARLRAMLAGDGRAVIKGFLTPDGVAAIAAEADGVPDQGHRSFGRTNPYSTAGDPTLPPDDPRCAFGDRSNNFIWAESFAAVGPPRTIHDFLGFDPVIRDCLEELAFHRYADALADVIVNMAEAGAGFPWHFDTNNFTVTLAVQNAAAGGAFE